MAARALFCTNLYKRRHGAQLLGSVWHLQSLNGAHLESRHNFREAMRQLLINDCRKLLDISRRVSGGQRETVVREAHCRRGRKIWQSEINKVCLKT